MSSLMSHACLRASELCDIDENDVDLKRLTVRIRSGKGGKEAISFITGECAQTLHQYLRVRPILEINGRTPLFYTDGGKRFDRTQVHHIFMLYKKKAGIKKIGGVQVFGRHTPATIMISNGCDIRIVQALLRHDDIRTTFRYAHVSEKTRQEWYNKTLTLYI